MSPEKGNGPVGDFNGKRVTVMGLGLSGGGAGSARFFCEQGARVTVTDLRSADELAESVSILKDLPVEFRLGEHCAKDFIETDLVIASPAVPPGSPHLKTAAAHGVDVESALTLFFRWCPGRIVGITGTLGKTTVTSLIGFILGKSDIRSWVGGNIGRNPLDFLSEMTREDVAVLEISSFQLEYLGPAGLGPDVAIVTGISPDHMDRYSSMQEYARAKRHILSNQAEGSTAFLNADCAALMEWRADCRGRLYTYGVETADADVCVQGDEIVFRGDAVASISDLRIGGRHNISNALGAAAVCSLLGCGRGVIDEGLAGFTGVEHRLEYVARVGEVMCYDDSAATTPGAVIAAIGAVESPIALILGGYDKGLDMSALIPVCVEQVEEVVMIGDSSEKLCGMFTQENPDFADAHVTTAASLDEAVRIACSSIPRGSVLLSPAYASFDMFRNYRERGRAFKETVYSLMSSR